MEGPNLPTVKLSFGQFHGSVEVIIDGVRDRIVQTALFDSPGAHMENP